MEEADPKIKHSRHNPKALKVVEYKPFSQHQKAGSKSAAGFLVLKVNDQLFFLYIER
ncbi:hypothetical protein [Paenibacillus lautus]|uniref:hypothetical protein n=1 Tax=Paenibacillus lautus TaxID=1401 RepID=UPI003D2B2EE6